MRFHTIIMSMFLIFIMSSFHQLALAQTNDDYLAIYESATENGFLPGSRSAGMGGAQIAAGNDGSVLWYNPALLTRLRKSEFSATLSHQKLKNNTALISGNTFNNDVGNTRLAGLWGIYSVPVDQGGLAFGLSINRIKSFDKIFRYASDQNWFNQIGTIDGWGGGEDEKGGLWSYSFGGAIEISPRASLGLSVDILDGNDDWAYFFDSTYTPAVYQYHYDHSISDDYAGITGKLGASYNVNDYLSLGAVVGFPTRLKIEQSSIISEFDSDGFDDTDQSFSKYSYTLPFWFGGGAALTIGDLTLAADMTYQDYSQIEYRSGFSDLAYYNRLAKNTYDGKFNFRVGGEYFLRPAGLKLRAGYYQEPIPYQGLPIETDPRYLTLGAGLILDRAVSLDIAYLSGLWEKDDPSIGSSEKYDIRRLLISLSFKL